MLATSPLPRELGPHTEPIRILPLHERTLLEGMGRSQADIAEALGTDQGEVSRIERRGDVRLSTLRRYAEAVGARLEVAFVFSDDGRRRALLEEPDASAEPVK